MAKRSVKGFVGADMHYGSIDPKNNAIVKRYRGTVDHAEYWRNRRPICPYGCGEEGNLLEIVVKDGKALGIYTHSGDVRPFTAELQMAPKPTGRKIALGPDGEPTMVEDT